MHVYICMCICMHTCVRACLRECMFVCVTQREGVGGRGAQEGLSEATLGACFPELQISTQ